MRTIECPALLNRARGWLRWKYYLLDNLQGRQQHGLLAAAAAAQVFATTLTGALFAGWITLGEFIARLAPLPLLMLATLAMFARYSARQIRLRLTPELIISTSSSPSAAKRGQ